MPSAFRNHFPGYASDFQVHGEPSAWLLIPLRSLPLLRVLADEVSAAAFAVARYSGLSVASVDDPVALRDGLISLCNGARDGS